MSWSAYIRGILSVSECRSGCTCRLYVLCNISSCVRLWGFPPWEVETRLYDLYDTMAEFLQRGVRAVSQEYIAYHLEARDFAPTAYFGVYSMVRRFQQWLVPCAHTTLQKTAFSYPTCLSFHPPLPASPCIALLPEKLELSALINLNFQHFGMRCSAPSTRRS